MGPSELCSCLPANRAVHMAPWGPAAPEAVPGAAPHATEGLEAVPSPAPRCPTLRWHRGSPCHRTFRGLGSARRPWKFPTSLPRQDLLRLSAQRARGQSPGRAAPLPRAWSAARALTLQKP